MGVATTSGSYRAQSPVLMLIHSRTEPTRRVFEAIRDAKPPRLYVAADGPRPSRAGEEEACRRCREIATQVDWDCEVKTLFRERNMGSANAIPEAIDWFFASEPEGIILEDDCLPSPDFFRFCDELLARYRESDRVMVIAGSNFLYSAQPSGYRYSSYSISWGWATWRRAWRHYRDPRTLEPAAIVRAGLARGTMEQTYWTLMLKYAFQIPNWDYRWLAAFWSNRGLCAIPTSNLISNIGFGEGAVHTANPDDERANLPLQPLQHPFAAPASLAPDADLDLHLERTCFRISWLTITKLAILSRVPALRKLKRYLRWRT